MNNESLVLKLISMILKSEEKCIGIDDKAEKETGFSFIGKKVLIRSRDAGVHFGTLIEDRDSHVVLSNARRMDRFYIGGGEDSLSGVARQGILKDDANSRISGVVPIQKIVNHCEIIALENNSAIETTESAPVFNKR